MLKLVTDCQLTNRKLKIKLGSLYSALQKILTRVPQGSALLFNVFIRDLLYSYLEAEIHSFSDSTALYDSVTIKLEDDLQNV